MSMASGMSGTATDTSYPENGRRYGTFRRLCYMMPCDDWEKDRLDIMHTLFKTVRDTRERERRLINAPFRAATPSPTGERSRVLDLGCGTGIWLLDMAEQFRDGEFLGIDLNTMAPDMLLPNVDIRIVDYETPWALGEFSWDLIHLQMALGSIAKWKTIYERILRHLKPGGWFESVEIDFTPRCTDGTLRPGPLIEWWRYVRQAYFDAGRPIDYNPNTGDELARVGFTDIAHQVYRLPLNAWPHQEDRAQHRAGNWYNVAMSSGVQGNGGFGMEAISLAALTRVNYTWPLDTTRRLIAEAIAQAADPAVHAFNEMHVWTARSPS